MTTKDFILEAQDLKTETINVPEWGCDVTLRAMTGTERDAFDQSLVLDGQRNIENLRARLLVKTIVDESGQRLFADEDAVALGKKSAAALDRCFDVAQRLNGLGVAQEAIAKN
jgi:hypothetical protein